MSLRGKVLVIVAAVVVAFGVVDHTIQHAVVYPQFVSLEEAEARKDLERCMEAIEREIAALRVTSKDYACWDDTYQFVVDGNQAYIKANLHTKNFHDLGVNVIYVCNRKGKVVWGRVMDLRTDRLIGVRSLPKDCFLPSHPLVARKNPNDRLSGILITEQGAVLLVSQPILNTSSEGPVRGAFILGKFLDAQVMDRLKDQTRVNLRVDPPLVAEETTILTSSAGAALAHSDARLDRSEKGVLQVSTVLTDVYGRSALPIRAVVPRKITAQGKAAMGFATASVAAAAVAIMTTLLVLLQRIVVTPLSRLTRHAIALGRSGDLSARFDSARKDEVGILGRAFDAMVEQLAEARRKLLEQSYRSGVAEMAAGVLHNVRNALTPVLVEVEELRQELAGTPLDQIEIARQELSKESVDEARRENLSRFLDLASGRLVFVARETNAKLESVVGRTRQIEQFLTDQEGASRADRPVEKVVLGEVVEEAVNLLSGEFRGCMSVQVDAELSSLGPVGTHRVSLLQILANLLTNAAESIQRSAKGHGTVEVAAGIEQIDREEMVHLRVKDNGDGILVENLERIFERGFTTKEGSSGLGLHWCANTVSAMKGRIYAESQGKGCGACLHLLVPRNL